MRNQIITKLTSLTGLSSNPSISIGRMQFTDLKTIQPSERFHSACGGGFLHFSGHAVAPSTAIAAVATHNLFGDKLSKRRHVHIIFDDKQIRIKSNDSASTELALVDYKTCGNTLKEI